MALIEDPIIPRPYRPPAPGAPPPGGGAPGGSWIPRTRVVSPDRATLMRNHPGYAHYLATKDARIGAAAQRRKGMIANLIRMFGGVPKTFTDKYGDVTSDVVAAGEQNENSAIALAKNRYEQGVEAMRRALAARGMLQSGELTYGQQRAEEAYGTEQYNLTEQFREALEGAIGGFTEEEGRVLGEEGQYIGDAAEWAAQMYPDYEEAYNEWAPAPPAPPPPPPPSPAPIPAVSGVLQELLRRYPRRPTGLVE